MRSAAWVAAIVAVAPGLLGAQEPPPTVPDVLSFEEAVRVALERSPAYLQQLSAVERAEYSERSSMGALLPSLNASLGFGGTTSRRITAVDEFDQPLEGPEQVRTNSSASQGVSGGITLFDLQQVRSWGAARAATAAQEAGVAARESLLRRQVGEAYFGVVQRARLLEVEERQLEMARQNLEAIRRLLRVAARQPTDVLGAELDLAQAQLGVDQARGELEKAKLSLKEVMGVPMSTAFEPTDAFPEEFDPATLSSADLMDRAARQNPGLVQEIRNVEAADRGLSAARASRLPSLSGNYRYSRGASLANYAALGEFDLPNWSWGFGLSVDIPLFNRLQTSAQIGQAQVETEIARESLRQARLQLEREVLAARIDLENAYAAVRVAERSVEIARERLDQGQALYRQGTLDYTALQQMLNGVANAERRLVNARSGFTTALLTLEEKVGGPIEVEQ